MAKAKYVNEHFFDEESKAMWYVRGAFIACYMPQPNNGILFRSSHRDFVDIVKEQLESEHAIVSYPRGKSSHWIRFENKPDLFHKLGEMGLNVPKSERTFPDIEDVGKQYLDHLVRGFFDAHVAVENRTVQSSSEHNPHELHYQRLTISFNVSFLESLYGFLVKYANVKGGREITKSQLSFGTPDARAIYDFIYRDWDFIQENRLYLPSKKELFERTSIEDLLGNRKHPHPNKVSAQKRIADGQELLLQGNGAEDVAKIVGYRFRTGFCRAFRRHTGETISQFLKEKAQKAVSL